MAEIEEKPSFLPDIAGDFDSKVKILLNDREIVNFKKWGKYLSIKVIIKGDENEYERLLTKQGLYELLQQG